jgi:hypothetical protein
MIVELAFLTAFDGAGTATLNGMATTTSDASFDGGGTVTCLNGAATTTSWISFWMELPVQH